MSASELLSSRLMFPTPLASDKSTGRDAANLDVFLSEGGILRKRNKDGTIWSLSLSAAVFYLTPAASEGYRSTLKPAAFRDKSPSSNLSAQVIRQEQPLSEKAALDVYKRQVRCRECTDGNTPCTKTQRLERQETMGNRHDWAQAQDNGLSLIHICVENPIEKQAIFPNHHEPIIDTETWERVQELSLIHI